MAGSAALELTPGTGRGYEVVGDLVLARSKGSGGKKEKEGRRLVGRWWESRGSECAVVSEEKKGKKQPTAAGERATNKLPGRSQRQVKQRRRG